MTRDSSEGGSLLSSKKAIVAIFAVALMLLSASAVVLADNSSAENAYSEVQNYTITFAPDTDNNPVMSPDTVPGITVSVDPTTKEVTISGEFVTSAQKCISIDSGLSDITFVIDGNLTLKSTIDSNQSRGIVSDGNITIKGTDKNEDKLTVETGTNGTGDRGIKASTLTMDKVTIEVTTHDMTSYSGKTIGIEASNHVSITDSTLIVNSGSVSNGGKMWGIYAGYGYNSPKFTRSDVYVNGGEITNTGESRGICFDGTISMDVFENSKVICEGMTYAINTTDYNGNPSAFPVSRVVKTGGPAFVYASEDGISYDSLESGNIDLKYKYVNLRLNPQYTVTYNNGEGVTGDVPTEMPHEQGEKFILQDVLVEKQGYTFDGWSDGTKTYKAGDEYTMGSSNVTFTAQWKQGGSSHTVTYDSNGATSGTVPTQDPVATGGTFTVAAPGDLVKTGYTFGGWNDGTKTYFQTETYTVGDKDVTLKAVWNKVEENMKVTTDSSGRAEVIVPTDSNVKTVVVSNGDKSITFGEDVIGQLKGNMLFVEITALSVADSYEIVTKLGNVEFKGKMTITLKYDSAKGTPQVYWKNGSIETAMPTTVNASEGTVSFVTDHNSTYVVKYTEKEKEQSFWDTPGNIAGVVAVTLLALLLVSLIVYFQVKK